MWPAQDFMVGLSEAGRARSEMSSFVLSVLILAFEPQSEGSRFNLAVTPIMEFKWWILLCFLAFHVVIAVVITELMGRTYGKWWLWLLVNFLFPIVGPVACLLYNWIASTSLVEARKSTFWQRFLIDSPVSLSKTLEAERAHAQEIPLRLQTGRILEHMKQNERDMAIDSLISKGKYAEARAKTWQMMSIAMEMRQDKEVSKLQDYLDVIATRESSERGFDAAGR
jgi:hypothetical protein